MRRYIFLCLSVLLLFSPVHLVVFAAENGEVNVSVSNLQVRSGPGLSYDVIGKVDKNETFSVIDRQKDWIKIKLKSGRNGWIAGWLTENSTSEQDTVTPKIKNLNVRKGPGTNYGLLGKIQPNDKYSVITSTDSWVKISYKGRDAWVAGWLVSFSGDIPERKKIPPGYNATVNATDLNLRKGPSLDQPVLRKLQKETGVRVIETKKDWSYIELETGEKGWTASKYLVKGKKVSSDNVVLLYNGSNLRAGPGINYKAIGLGNKGDQFQLIGREGEWLKVSLPSGKQAYVASWIVSTSPSTPSIIHPGLKNGLHGKTIVIDPGHGGYDSGTKGTSFHSFEKDLTLRTANLLNELLKKAGAKTVMTRTGDTYIALSDRVSISHRQKADAFISIHFDSSNFIGANGITSYYYSESDKQLAKDIHKQLIKNTGLRDRKVRYGNYHVLRTNAAPSVLFELGYLSNPWEETILNTTSYQIKASNAIFNGLVDYFNSY
ncbi:N-acetylmuramoyl-L-alanine amidase [Pseudalkalibacillus caeni]|uniref:N-acetylmuramoyl-L-alanine amidase n=1 Tax=Exobacillus caeni TaxID=2574798 RepID=UPI001484D89D|nr:N-acetylmuramoyl-L-alanine amidase [Pseudalkalibacillus caeni]